MRLEVREGGIEPPRRSYGVTARWAHHLPNSRWGALPESNRPSRLHGPAPSRDGKRHQSIRQDSNLRHPVWDRRSGLAELLIGASTSASGGTRTPSPQIRNLML